MKSYELQINMDGKWTIDAVFDDREFALLEAKRAETNRRYLMLRVVEEVHDEEQHRTVARTIYNSSRSGASAPARSSPAAHGRASRPTVQSLAAKRAKAPPQKKQPSFIGILAKLLVIVLAGLAALYGLWQLPNGS